MGGKRTLEDENGNRKAVAMVQVREEAAWQEGGRCGRREKGYLRGPSQMALTGHKGSEQRGGPHLLGHIS